MWRHRWSACGSGLWPNFPAQSVQRRILSCAGKEQNPESFLWWSWLEVCSKERHLPLTSKLSFWLRSRDSLSDVTSCWEVEMSASHKSPTTHAISTYKLIVNCTWLQPMRSYTLNTAHTVLYRSRRRLLNWRAHLEFCRFHGVLSVVLWRGQWDDEDRHCQVQSSRTREVMTSTVAVPPRCRLVL